MEEEISSRSVEEVDNEREMESLRKLEAALFIAGKFLSVPELVALTDINPILLKKMLEDLQDGYQEKGMVLIEQN